MELSTQLCELLLDNPGLIPIQVNIDLQCYLYPAPELSSILITNCANNTNILLYKLANILCPGLRIDRDFVYFTVDKDLFIADQNHGIYNAVHPSLSSSKPIYMLDLLRLRYTEYQYMTKVLDSLIKCRRLDTELGEKQIIIVNNFDLVLPQYLPKFIEYIDKYHITTTFILVGSGPNITHISTNTKLSATCYIKRVNFEPVDKFMKIEKKLHTYHKKNLVELSRILYKLTAGDVLKSWIVCSAYLDKLTSSLNVKKKAVLLAKPELLFQAILPMLPVYNKIYSMLLDLINPDLLLANQHRNVYMVFAFPGMTVSRFCSITYNLLYIINQQASSGAKVDPDPGESRIGESLIDPVKSQIVLSVGDLVKLANLSAKYSALDVNYVDEPVIIAQEYMLAVRELVVNK